MNCPYQLRHSRTHGPSNKPIIVSRSFMANWSLRDMGSPCKDPIGLPVSERYLSSSFARARARSTKISVKQLVWVMCYTAIGMCKKGTNKLMSNDRSFIECQCHFIGRPMAWGEEPQHEPYVSCLRYSELPLCQEWTRARNVDDIYLLWRGRLYNPFFRYLI